MCRLFGYVTDTDRSVADLLGDEGLAAFTSLTVVHDDGWGAAWHESSGTAPVTPRTFTSPRSAALDPEYDALVHRPLSCAGLLHLRWATGGLDVRAENTHPFREGVYAFAHNGHVSPIPRLEALLTPESRARLVGDTDSERYFRFVLQTIDEHGGDEVEGVTQALATLLREFPTSSLNALMLAPERMFAIHINSRADSPSDLRTMVDDDPLPVRHATEYFAMDYRIREGSIEVVSSGLDQPGWTPVPADTAVVVDLATREVTRLDPVVALGERSQ